MYIYIYVCVCVLICSEKEKIYIYTYIYIFTRLGPYSTDLDTLDPYHIYIYINIPR